MQDKSIHELLRSIQSDWGLTPIQMAALAHVDPSKYESWMRPQERLETATVPPGMESAVPLISIYRRLAARFPETADQAQWMTRAHQDFDGHKPIDVAASSVENLYWLGYYLESSSLSS